MEPRPIVQVLETTYLLEITEPAANLVQVSGDNQEVEPAPPDIETSLLIEAPQANIIEPSEVTQSVEVSGESVTIIEPAIVGPQGAPGAPGDLVDTNYFAGEPLGGQRVVIVGDDSKLYYADSANLTHFNRVLGVTTGAVILDARASVRIGGPMTEPTWNWDLRKFLYLGSNGLLTQTPPAAGFLLQIGWPISPSCIMIEIQMPLLLA